MNRNEYWVDYASDVYLLEHKRQWEKEIEEMHRADWRNLGRGILWSLSITAALGAVILLGLWLWK